MKSEDLPPEIDEREAKKEQRIAEARTEVGRTLAVAQSMIEQAAQYACHEGLYSHTHRILEVRKMLEALVDDCGVEW